MQTSSLGPDAERGEMKIPRTERRVARYFSPGGRVHPICFSDLDIDVAFVEAVPDAPASGD